MQGARRTLVILLAARTSGPTQQVLVEQLGQRSARARAEAAAAAVEKIAKKGGLSADSVDQLRREILGIAA